jgi:hypothetical protein
LRLDSIAREQMRTAESRDETSAAPHVRSSRRIVVPIELDLDQVDSGESIELVLRLEIGHVRGRRQFPVDPRRMRC